MSPTTATTTTIDRASHTIHFQRTFAASREQVFDAWTDPDQLRLWWDPSGTPLAECTIDLRVGGAFRLVNQGNAHSPPFAGVYKVLDRPGTLVFDALGALGTVRLEQRGAVTQMDVSIRCSSAEHLAQYLQLGVDAGTARTLDNLVAYLGGPG